MKKLLSLFIICTLFVVTTGCGNSTGSKSITGSPNTIIENEEDSRKKPGILEIKSKDDADTESAAEPSEAIESGVLEFNISWTGKYDDMGDEGPLMQLFASLEGEMDDGTVLQYEDGRITNSKTGETVGVCGAKYGEDSGSSFVRINDIKADDGIFVFKIEDELYGRYLDSMSNATIKADISFAGKEYHFEPFGDEETVYSEYSVRSYTGYLCWAVSFDHGEMVPRDILFQKWAEKEYNSSEADEIFKAWFEEEYGAVMENNQFVSSTDYFYLEDKPTIRYIIDNIKNIDYKEDGLYILCDVWFTEYIEKNLADSLKVGDRIEYLNQLCEVTNAHVAHDGVTLIKDIAVPDDSVNTYSIVIEEDSSIPEFFCVKPGCYSVVLSDETEVDIGWPERKLKENITILIEPNAVIKYFPIVHDYKWDAMDADVFFSNHPELWKSGGRFTNVFKGFLEVKNGKATGVMEMYYP